MPETRLSVVITGNDRGRKEIAVTRQGKLASSLNGLPASLNSIAYFNTQENIETLWNCADRVDEILRPLIDNTKGYHSGMHIQVSVIPGQIGEEPQVSVGIFDLHYQTSSSLTGACAGYLLALAENSHSRNKPTFDIEPNKSTSRIRFTSLNDLVMALNVKAKSQDQKINISGSGIGR